MSKKNKLKDSHCENCFFPIPIWVSPCPHCGSILTYSSDINDEWTEKDDLAESDFLENKSQFLGIMNPFMYKLEENEVLADENAFEFWFTPSQMSKPDYDLLSFLRFSLITECLILHDKVILSVRDKDSNFLKSSNLTMIISFSD